MNRNKFLAGISAFSLFLNVFYTPSVVLAQELSQSTSEQNIELVENTSSDIPLTTTSEVVAPVESPAEIPTVNQSSQPTLEIEVEEVAPVVIEEAEVINEEKPVESDEGIPFDIEETNQAPSAQLKPSLTTNLEDYAPNDMVIITGSNFVPNTAYTIVISADNYLFEDTVVSGEDGSLAYDFQLDGTERPLYLIKIIDGSGNEIATKEFTDCAVPKICGDNIKNGSEECDGTDLGGLSASEFYCKKNCTLDLIEPRVKICHSTSSNSNPYFENEPDKSADVNGHDGHNGPVWYEGITGDWGDIIPPFNYIGGSYPGKNWNEEGKVIYDNDCEIPVIPTPPVTGKITVIKDAQPQDSQDFTFYWQENVPGSANNQFSLDDDDDPAMSNTYIIDNLKPGKYSVIEKNIPVGWNLDSISCKNAAGAEVGYMFISNNGNPRKGVVDLNIAASDEITCTFINKYNETGSPSIDIEKSGPDHAYVIYPTSYLSYVYIPVTYTYEVTNNGNVDLENVVVTDDKCAPVVYGSGDNGDGLLNPNEVWTYSCDYNDKLDTINPLTNTAIATGYYKGQPVSDNDNFTYYPFSIGKAVRLYVDSQNVEYTDPDTEFHFSIKKDGIIKEADLVITENTKYLYRLTPGIWEFCEFNMPGGYEPAHFGGCFTFNTSLGERPANAFQNVIRFDLSIEKSAPSDVVFGKQFYYTYIVSNTGPASVTPIVEDDKCASVEYVGGDVNDNSLIDSSEMWTYQCAYVVDKESDTECITNTVVVYDKEGTIYSPTEYRHGGDVDPSNNSDTATVCPGESRGSIEGYKWNDLNGNSERDCEIDFGVMRSDLVSNNLSCEPKLSDWEIQLWSENKTDLIQTVSTDINGNYLFEDVTAGDYYVCENQKPGWTATYPVGLCHLVQIFAGSVITNINFGNTLDQAGLFLAKSNSVTGSVGRGSVVGYKLEITNIGNMDLAEVKIFDVLPGGFTYENDTSYLDGIKISDPVNDSGKLTWNIGTLESGVKKTLIYSVKVGDSVPFGIHTNIAYAKGAHSIGLFVIDSNSGEVVTSDVEVAVGADISTHVEGMVLGASTQVLPATGSNSLVLFLAIIMLTAGLYIRRKYNNKNMKNIVKSIVLSLFVSLTCLVPAVGAVSDYIRISELPQYTNNPDFMISYAAVSDNPIEVKFYVKKDGDSSWKEFGNPNNLASGQIQVNGNQFYNGDGKYFFKGVLNNGVSDETDIEIDRGGLAAVSDYRRENYNGWAKLFWKNPHDKDFSRVFIYRSTEQQFRADGSTKVAEVGGAPEQDMAWENYGLDTTKTYYYALRAIDKAGNASPIVSDIPAQILGTIITSDEEVIQVPLETKALGSEEGEVKAAEDEVEEVKQGSILEGVSDLIKESTPTRKILLVVSILGLVYLIFRRFRK